MNGMITDYNRKLRPEERGTGTIGVQQHLLGFSTPSTGKACGASLLTPRFARFCRLKLGIRTIKVESAHLR